MVGTLPPHLAAVARSITTIDMQQRGKDITPSEMDEAGAYLASYITIGLPCAVTATVFESVLRAIESAVLHANPASPPDLTSPPDLASLPDPD